ncbi:MAG TPA: sugar ABC transporter substrate-binding protein [Pseudonocardiaceae bacterium]
MTRTPRWAAVLAAGALLLAAGCSSQGGKEAEQEGSGGATASCDDPGLTVAVVSHGKQGDSFWDVVKRGAEDAGKQLCVKVTYQGSGDPNEQAQAIDNAVAQRVGGLVVSMANPDALKSSIQKAVAAGVPVITINSGGDRSAEFGALTHVGQAERTAGEGAGQQLAEAGVTNLVCVIHEAGNVGLEERCAGAAATLGGTTKNLQVNVSDLNEATTTIQSALQADPSINGVLTLNDGVGKSAVAAVKGAGSAAQVATFDVNADVIKAVKDGSVLFAVDQQPYTQGYLPVTFLKLYADNANVIGGGRPVLTGPSFVTKDNADAVEQYAARGTR